MFYGTPGCGKSSCIKALATYTKRHIHYLMLSDIKSDNELLKLLEDINFSDTILVIEDIDCASNVTHQRGEESKEEEKESDEEKSTLSLSGLLNALDGGVIDSHGQILVMTTNFPEKLDSALTREGRVDLRFEFTYCTNQQIKDLYVSFFKVSPPTEKEFKTELTPAKVRGVFLKYKKNPEAAWEKLCEEFE